MEGPGTFAERAAWAAAQFDAADLGDRRRTRRLVRLADDFFDSQMVAVMAAYLKTAASTLTLAGFWRGIGRLGGHVGRKCDGPLGWLRAWRGWRSFQLLVLGASLRARDA